jgi:hypothetical protein
MKSLICCCVLLASLAGFASAAEIKGYLLDKSCADEDGKKPGFAAMHQKSCLQMKVCVQSGYGVMTEDMKYLTFDKNGNAMATKLIAGLKKTDDIRIAVTGDVQGETIKVTKLALQ